MIDFILLAISFGALLTALVVFVDILLYIDDDDNFMV
jgi:hypothetical protein